MRREEGVCLSLKKVRVRERLTANKSKRSKREKGEESKDRLEKKERSSKLKEEERKE